METVWASRLKESILWPFGLVLLMLTLLFSGYIYQRESRDIDAQAAATFAAAERTYLQIVKTDTEKNSAVLDVIVRDGNLRQAFIKRDHALLLQQSQVLFEQMKSDYGISHLSFVTPERAVFLRVHQPQKFGDQTQHWVMRQAEQTQLPAAGLELDQTGRFALRVAYPWYEGGTLIGYVELGEDVDHLLSQVSAIHQLELLFRIEKKLLRLQEWRAATTLTWNWLPEHVIAYRSSAVEQSELQHLLSKPNQQLNGLLQFQQSGVSYRLKRYPIFDASKQAVGDLVWKLDVTNHVVERNALLAFTMIFSALLALMLLGVMHWLLSRVDLQIKDWQVEVARGGQQLKAVFEGSPDALMLLDENGFFECNQRTLDLFGFTNRDAFMAKTLADLASQQQVNGQSSVEMAKYAIQCALDQGVYHFEWLSQRQNGSAFPAEILLSSFDYGGRLVLQATVRDITERQHLLQQVLHNELLWSSALEGAGDSVWDWNVLTGEVSLSKAGARLLGYEGDDPIASISDWIERLNPTDQQRWRLLFRDFFHYKQQRFSMEYQVRCKDGSWKWILSRGTVAERSVDGRVSRMVGVHSDIHTRKMAEERVRLFASIFNQAERGLVVVDDLGQLAYVNPAAERLYGYAANEMLHHHFGLLFTESALLQSIEFMEVITQGQGWNGLLLMRRKDGSDFLASSSVAAVQDESGEHRYWFNIFYDYTPELMRQQELQQARERADAANLAKSEFLANMSHEIRTPMNAIIGLSYLTLETELEPKQRDHLQKIHQASQLLLGIINDILDFSKIEAGKLELEQLPFTLDQLFVNLVTIVANNVRNKQLQLLINISPDVPDLLLGDSLRLEQILINLVGNAIKFTDQGLISVGVTLLEWSDQYANLQFEVRDTGMGMGEAQLSRLFQAFSQADSSITRRFGGTGLGLTICKRLVDMMGGSISVFSREQQGTVFCFNVLLACQTPARSQWSLPKNLPRRVALLLDENDPSQPILRQQLLSLGMELVELTQAETCLIDKNSEARLGAVLADTSHYRRWIWLASDEQEYPTLFDVSACLLKPVLLLDLFNCLLSIWGYEQSLCQRQLDQFHAKKQATGQLNGAHVLLVEDNAINQEIAQELLHKVGVSCVVAEHGQQALDFLVQQEFDAVLMDVQMPVMDGITAVQAIRRQPQFATLPVIAVTANSLNSEQNRYFAVGFDDVVAKPFNPERLFEVLLKWLVPAGDNPVYVLSQDELSLVLPTLPDVNVAQGVARVGGSLSVYLNILRKFAEGQTHTVEQIRNALTLGDWVTAQRLIHTLKGLSGSIGANVLYELAKTLENAIRHNDALETQMSLPLVGASLNALLLDIGELLATQNQIALAPPSVLNIEQIQQLLIQVRQQLACFDSEAEQALSQLIQQLPREYAACLQPVLHSVTQYDFDQALQLFLQLDFSQMTNEDKKV